MDAQSTMDLDICLINIFPCNMPWQTLLPSRSCHTCCSQISNLWFNSSAILLSIFVYPPLYSLLKPCCGHPGAAQKFGMSRLSELVWSPDEGLSIKIAASSLSTRKASLRWNADTLNIVISSPQQSGAAAKSADNVDANLGVSEKMPSQLRTHSDSSVRITMTSPNNIANLDALQSVSMRSQEQDSSKCKRQCNSVC
jgi:hypothetical protein